jgi:hypothetical protein
MHEDHAAKSTPAQKHVKLTKLISLSCLGFEVVQVSIEINMIARKNYFDKMHHAVYPLKSTTSTIVRSFVWFNVRQQDNGVSRITAI